MLENAQKLCADAGLSIGAYLRTLAFGKPGPRAVRRPPIERKELARLLGHLGKIGSNINQIAHRYNITEGRPSGNIEGALETALNELLEWRMALMQALGYERNRKPPQE